MFLMDILREIYFEYIGQQKLIFQHLMVSGFIFLTKHNNSSMKINLPRNRMLLEDISKSTAFNSEKNLGLKPPKKILH
jgi:hypothetical protein